MKKLVKIIPELFFMALGLYWALENYIASGHRNYIAALVVWLMFLQIFYKNKVLGLIYGTIMAATSAFMMVAVFAEFKEFHTFTSQAGQLLTVGMGIFGTGTVMAGFMIYKYAVAKTNYDESVLTVTY